MKTYATLLALNLLILTSTTQTKPKKMPQSQETSTAQSDTTTINPKSEATTKAEATSLTTTEQTATIQVASTEHSSTSDIQQKNESAAINESTPAKKAEQKPESTVKDDDGNNEVLISTPSIQNFARQSEAQSQPAEGALRGLSTDTIAVKQSEVVPNNSFVQITAAQQNAASAETPRSTTPCLSAEEIQRAQTLQALAEEERKLAIARSDGWDTASDNEPRSTKPTPPWYDAITTMPAEWWKTHVTDKNRVEQFMRFAGLVKTYTILSQKLTEGTFGLFIDDLNTNASEGHRWIDEALLQATEDKQEGTVRTIMHAAIPYKNNLPPATRSKVAEYLIERAEKKRKALAAEQEEFASDISELTRIIREAAEDRPNTQDIPVEILEQCAAETALTLTKCASGGYLPRPKSMALTDRK